MYADQQRDDVSNIHRRWSLTRFNPSSSRTSITTSLLCVFGFSIVSLTLYLGAPTSTILLHLPLALGVMIVAHYADYLALKGTPINKLSKVSHVAAFANLLWLITVLAGILASVLFARSLQTADYIIAGMLLAIGLRIGIFTSVFGAGTARAVGVSFIMPLMILFALVPPVSYGLLEKGYNGMIFGTALVALGVSWTLVADRAGRPEVTSTFRLLQAFLSAWSENKVDKLEEYTDSRAHEENVTTTILKFSGASKPSIVLPQVHPGPFGSVGGSNLPYVIFESLGKNALVMHSASDHSLNLPSREEVSKYIKSLSKLTKVSSGDTCSLPKQERVGKATVSGIAFGNNAVITLSLAPHGADDIPDDLQIAIQNHADKLGFTKLLVVDSHNSMGHNLDTQDNADMAEAAKRCLTELKNATQYPFSVGYANSQSTSELSQEVGRAGLAVLGLKINDSYFAIGWADANNIQNGLREAIISSVAAVHDGSSSSSSRRQLLELCSSDTHATSGKRTREGYFPMGTTTNHELITSVFRNLCEQAWATMETSTFEISNAQSKVKVMGEQQFEDYSKALDNSIRVTKAFLIASVATFIAMLVL